MAQIIWACAGSGSMWTTWRYLYRLGGNLSQLISSFPSLWQLAIGALYNARKSNRRPTISHFVAVKTIRWKPDQLVACYSSVLYIVHCHCVQKKSEPTKDFAISRVNLHRIKCKCYVRIATCISNSGVKFLQKRAYILAFVRNQT